MTTAASTTCPRCGSDNRCGIGAVQPCWCATELAQRLPLQPAATACYCRSCLEQLIAEREHAADEKPG